MVLNKNGLYNIKVFQDIKKNKVLIMDYPILKKTLEAPKLNKLYVFHDYRGFGLKIRYKTLKNNKVNFEEDILAFHEYFNIDLENASLVIENNYQLSDKQRVINFMSDEFYNLLGNRHFYRHYFMSGIYKDEAVSSL